MGNLTAATTPGCVGWAVVMLGLKVWIDKRDRSMSQTDDAQMDRWTISLY